MKATNVCPRCGSEDVFERKNMCICGECGHRFQLEESTAQSEDEILLSTTTPSPMRIFLSYAHKELQIVQDVENALLKRGHEIWFDQKDIGHGDDWRKKITDGLISSNGVLSFLSREAIRQKGVCLDELGIAVGVKYAQIRTVILQKESELQPIPAQLTHRQWLDMSDWESRLAEGPEAYRSWLNKNLAIIIRMIESDESREFEGNISLIRKTLDITDTAISRQSWYLKQSFVGREWLTAEIEGWLNDPNGGHMCAVYGEPGVGKSAFAAQFVYHSPRIAASLFFEHGNSYFNSPEAIVRELIFQMACRLPEYRSALVYRLNERQDLRSLSLQELFEYLFAVPLQYSVDGGHEPLCIVVDGLDECAEEDRRMVVLLLKSERFPAWLRVLVLSRPESDIIDMIAPDKEINISERLEESSLDIRAYYEQRLEKQLKEQPNAKKILDALTERAEGVFLYAYVITDMILGGKLDLADPSGYPRGLNASFNLWFSRYFENREEYNRIYRVPLGILAANAKPVPVEDLEAADGFYDSVSHSYCLRERDENKRPERMEKRLEKCAMLLKYGNDEFGNETVTFAHRYIGEWLSGEASREFSCAPQDAFWLLQRAWRNQIKAGKDLTQYQVLNLLDAMKMAEESEEAIQAVAKEEALGKALNEYREQYHEKENWLVCLMFAEMELYRCRLAHGEEHVHTKKARCNMATTCHKMIEDMLDVCYHARKITEMEDLDTGISTWNFERVWEDMDVLIPTCRLAITCRYIMWPQARLKVSQNDYAVEEPVTMADQMFRNYLVDAYFNMEYMDYEDELGADMINDLKKVADVCQDIDKYKGDIEPHILNTLRNVAAACYPDERALELQKKVYVIYKHNLGEDHPETLLIKDSISIMEYLDGIS